MSSEANLSQQELVSLLRQALESSAFAEKIERHDHILLGNGQEGLVVKFSTLETKMDADLAQIKKEIGVIQKDLRELKGWKGKVIVKAAMAMGGVAVVSFLGSAVFFNTDKVVTIIKAFSGH